MTKRPVYRIELVPVEGVIGDQATRSLRALLKCLGRSFGLRCTYAAEVKDDDELPVDGTDS